MQVPGATRKTVPTRPFQLAIVVTAGVTAVAVAALADVSPAVATVSSRSRAFCRRRSQIPDPRQASPPARKPIQTPSGMSLVVGSVS